MYILDTLFQGGAVVKNLPANVAVKDSIPGSGRSPVEGDGNLLQYSCMNIPMDRGAYSSWGLKELATTKHAHTNTHILIKKSCHGLTGFFTFNLRLYSELLPIP